VIQSTAFLLGARALLRRVMSDRAAAIVAVVVLLSPQNIAVMAVVWKECQMAGFLLAGAGALLSPSRRWRLAGYLFLFMATGVRYDAPAATLPIIVLLFGWERSLGRWRRLGLAIAAWVGITVAAFAIGRLLTEKETYPWHNRSAPVDIVGIVRYAAHLQNDDLLRDTQGVPWVHTDKIRVKVRKMYTPGISFLDVTQGPNKLIEAPASEAQREALTAAWETLLLEYPRAFLRHRLSMFVGGVEVPTGGDGGLWTKFTNTAWADGLLHHRASHGWVQQQWIGGTLVYDRWFGCRVLVYLLVALALLPMCRRDRLAFALLASGLLHELGLFLAAPAIDYRSSHWLVVATMIGAIALFVTRLRLATPAAGMALQGELR
jgi:hypothetical protein